MGPLPAAVSREYFSLAQELEETSENVSWIKTHFFKKKKKS
jgi:hypothetical protein